MQVLYKKLDVDEFINIYFCKKKFEKIFKLKFFLIKKYIYKGFLNKLKLFKNNFDIVSNFNISYDVLKEI
jgi:hypothetical protein